MRILILYNQGSFPRHDPLTVLAETWQGDEGIPWYDECNIWAGTPPWVEDPKKKSWDPVSGLGLCRGLELTAGFKFASGIEMYWSKLSTHAS